LESNPKNIFINSNRKVAILSMVKPATPIVGCFPSIAVCKSISAVSNPSVFAMDKSPSSIVGCFPSIAVCKSISAVSNPSVFAMDKSPSSIVGCFPSIAVCNPLVLNPHLVLCFVLFLFHQ